MLSSSRMFILLFAISSLLLVVSLSNPFADFASAASPSAPLLQSPPNSWSVLTAPGNVTFQWSYGGIDINNMWYYFVLIKWDGTKWITVNSEYTPKNLSITKSLTDTNAFYAWQVAAVDITQVNPCTNTWYTWAQDWNRLHIGNPTTPTPTPVPTPTPALTTYTCTINPTTYNNMITFGNITASECYASGDNYICTFSKSDYDAFISWGRFLPSACVADRATPTPAPSSTPSSNPCTEGTGTANAPCAPSNPAVRTVTVCASGCDYSTIQAAVNAAQPGWTIQVKNGTYGTTGANNIDSVDINTSCTQANPCTLMAYPGQYPLINCTGTDVNHVLPHQFAFLFNASRWWILDGFEVKNCADAVYFAFNWTEQRAAGNITVRNMNIHDNASQGTLAQIADNIYIARNTFHDIGLCSSSACTSDIGGTEHAHAIYNAGCPVDNSSCFASKCMTTNVTMRGNTIYNIPGTGIHNWSSNNCTQTTGTMLMENNLVINTYDGIEYSKGYSNGNIARNNTVVLTNPPLNVSWSSSIGNHAELATVAYTLGSSSKNLWYNNIFYTTLTGFTTTSGQHFTVYGANLTVNNNLSEVTNANTFDYNLWYVPSNINFIEGNNGAKGFLSNWRSDIGWDAHIPGTFGLTDPVFTLFPNDLHIQSSSPARNTGSNAVCAITDKDGVIRPQESTCDIGAYEYKP